MFLSMVMQDQEEPSTGGVEIEGRDEESPNGGESNEHRQSAFRKAQISGSQFRDGIDGELTSLRNPHLH